MFRIRHLAASLVLTGGLGLAGLTLVQVDELQERRVVGAFNDAADDRLETIAQHIRAELDAVASVSAFFNASGRVERADFAAFASTLLTWSPGLQSLQWVPRVTAGERSVFEQAARDDGLTAFEFSELTTSGAIVRAADRTEHFPAYYVEPQRGNGAALGFDLGSDPARMSALVKARDSGQLTATEPLATPQGRGDTATVQLVLPVYRGGRDPLDVTQRRRQLLGFAVGVLRIDAMVAGALGGGSLGEAPGNDRAAPSASLYVFDDTSRPDGQLLHYQDPDGGVASGTILPAGGVAEAARRRPEAGANLHRTRAIAIGGRTWTIVMGSTDDTQRGITGWQPWVAMSGVLAAAMFAAFHVGAPVGRRRMSARRSAGAGRRRRRWRNR